MEGAVKTRLLATRRSSCRQRIIGVYRRSNFLDRNQMNYLVQNDYFDRGCTPMNADKARGI